MPDLEPARPDAATDEPAAVWVPIDRLKPWERNPRLNDGAVDRVAESIKRFGFGAPILARRADGEIIAGHTRLKAARKLGLEQVPVRFLDLDPADAHLLALADNRLSEVAEWNEDALGEVLRELQAEDMDLEVAGFDEDELAELLAEDAGGGDPDAVPEAPDEAITRPGDLWILGDHRLLCADSAKAADVDRLLAGAPIHLVNTDPPYNVKVEPRSNNAIAAGLSSFKTTHHQKLDVARHPEKSEPTTKKLRPKDRPLINDFVSEEEFDRMLRAWFGNMARVLVPGRCFYIWGGYANCANYPPALKEAELYFSQAIIWDKQHPVLTRKDFMGAHEWCQPGDTKVETPEGPVPIASLRDGDRVVSFTPRSYAMIGLRDGLEVRKGERDYNGELFGIVAEGKTTWATDGHPWTVKISVAARSMWCVYLMRRGCWWRVGKTKLFTTWGFGLKQRLAMEGGEEGWILSVHPSNVEATLAEQLVSVRYGIPTTFWRSRAVTQRTEDQIRGFYESLDLGVLGRAAERALLDHHRRVEFPFIRQGRTRAKFGTRVAVIIRSCNLLPGIMMVPIPLGGQKFGWGQIREVLHERYAGKVYSLDVDRYHHYIADGLVTHNCFYGWKKGAGHSFFGPNNATDLWAVKKVNPQSMIHLTEKPVELATRAIEYSSKRGEHVLDLFGGSGSTLIGAEMTGRRAFLMELDPLYCDVIVRRWEEFTGRKVDREPAPGAVTQPTQSVGT